LLLNSDTTVSVRTAGNTLTLSNLLPSTRALTKTGPGALLVNNVRAGALNVNSGSVKVIANGTDSGTSRVSALTVAGAAFLDLNNNSMVVDYTAGSPLTNIAALITSGYAGGAWNGPGINSSAVAANNAVVGTHFLALGYIEAGILNIPSFKGQSINGPAVLIRYTAAGDSNLDGSVDTVDFNNLAANFAGGNKIWSQGDYNYDTSVDSVDFNLLASNFGFTVPGDAGSLGALVPEPASAAALLAIGLIGLSTRRRHRSDSSRT